MKPLKGLLPLSSWIMRLSIVFFALTRYGNTVLHFNIQSVMFYVSILFVVFSFLLFIGGFLAKNTFTVISALVLVLVTGYHAFLNLGSKLNYNFAIFVLVGSVCLYFLSSGNKR